MKRRVLALALALAMVLVMVPVLADESDPTQTEGSTGDNTKTQTTTTAIGAPEGSTPSNDVQQGSGDQAGGGTSGTGTDSSQPSGGTSDGGTTTSAGTGSTETSGTVTEGGSAKTESDDTGSGSTQIADSSALISGFSSSKSKIEIPSVPKVPVQRLQTCPPHDYSLWTVTMSATCTTPGIETITCSRCGEKGTETRTIPATGHSYSVSWYWTSNYTSAEATFICTRCGEGGRASATVSMTNDGYRYVYSAVAVFGDRVETDTRTVAYRNYCYDPCYDRTYYNTCRPVWCDTSYTACGPCGHWGCGNVCTRYSSCTPCKNYTPTFRVGGYSCLATPKTGDVSVIAPAILALIGAAGAMLGKKRR